MKKLSVLLLIGYCLLPLGERAQTFAEWFHQKRMQIKYLRTQIAELQVYLSYVKKGYKIASAGLNAVRDVKKGEFSLHKRYYTSLGLVNPRIRSSPKAMGIVDHQQYILKTTTALRELLQRDKQLPAARKAYIIECMDRLLADLEKVRQELLDLTTDRTFELTDNERLERLNELYERSKSQFVFIQQFSAEVFTLTGAIRREQADERVLEQFYDLR